MKDVVPAMTFQISRPNWLMVFASDSEGVSSSSLGGFGVAVQAVTAEEWSVTLRSGVQPAFTVSRLDGSIAHMRDPLKELKARIPIPRIPGAVLEEDRLWVPIAQGRWKFNEHITLTEGRATNILLQRLALIPDAHGKTHISLCDNLGWCAASAKGRPPAYGLNQLLRRRAAILVASDMQVLHPWVDTHRMPANSLSREV